MMLSMTSTGGAAMSERMARAQLRIADRRIAILDMKLSVIDIQLRAADGHPGVVASSPRPCADLDGPGADGSRLLH